MSSAYFSNHSGSRFLANGAQPVGANSQCAGSPGKVSSSAEQNPRRMSSKHFSTTVNPTPTSPSKHPATSAHPLRHTWIFWFRQQRTPGNKLISYEEGIKKIAAFSSVESFWSLWTHLSPPSSLQPTTDYLLFHSGIRRPIWEDPLNISGGKWIVRLKKGIADRFWEDLVMAIIGDQLDECSSVRTPLSSASFSSVEAGGSKPEGEGGKNEVEWPEICGCTISVRQSEDIVSIWNRVEGDMKVRDQIRDTLRKVLNLPASTVMEYKSNNDSMQGKPTFRRTTMDRGNPPANS